MGNRTGAIVNLITRADGAVAGYRHLAGLIVDRATGIDGGVAAVTDNACCITVNEIARSNVDIDCLFRTDLAGVIGNAGLRV